MLTILLATVDAFATKPEFSVGDLYIGTVIMDIIILAIVNDKINNK